MWYRRIAVMLTAALLLAGTAATARALGTLAGTSITNQAYADYNDINGNPRNRAYSNEVTTVVSQVASVAIDPAAGAKNGIAGTDVWYSATVHNYGNGTDTFDLTAVDTTLGWTVTIYRDDNQNGIWDPGETTVITNTGPLAADGYTSVIVVTAVPSGANLNDWTTLKLTATSQFDGNVSAAGYYTTTVQAASLQITKAVYYDDPEGDGPAPGEVITFAITGSNAGTADALNIVARDTIPEGTTYKTGSMRIGPVGGTYETALAATDAADADSGYYNSGADRVELTWGTEPAGGGGGVFYFQVTVDTGLLQGTPIENLASASYQLVSGGTTYTATSNQTTSTTGYYTAILLHPDRVGYGEPGDTVTYAFTAYNYGNHADKINLATVSGAGWSWTLWADVNQNGVAGDDGDYQLSDTDNDGQIDTGNLTPNGGSIALLAVTTIPAGSVDGAVDITTITGSSKFDPPVTDPEILNTTVRAPVVSVSKVVSPEGPQPPGAVLTYTVTVTNTGSGTATGLVITDSIPSYTTYNPGSIYTGTTVGSLVQRSDGADGDGARYNAGSNAVVVGAGSVINLGPGGTWVVRFSVTIQ